MSNLEIYNKVSPVPKEAQKPITAGRIKGMTDINPMWRIKTLTEIFGMVGIGWKYTIKDKQIIEGADGVMCAFVDIDLFVKVDGQWSEAIQGTGGSQFVSVERNGKYTNDECFKMALTDALSVSCKALGIGADVYWASGRTKYDDNPQNKAPTPVVDYRVMLAVELKRRGIDVNEFSKEHNLNKETSPEELKALYDSLLMKKKGE